MVILDLERNGWQPDLHDKCKKSRHIVFVFRWCQKREWAWLRLLGFCGYGMKYGIFEKVLLW